MRRRVKRVAIILTLLTACVSLSLGQNLIPNGGFEQVDGEVAAEWLQPPEPYFHFEDSSMGRPYAGQHYNGICIYNHDICEYLTVKLDEPLYTGQEYCFTMYVRLAKFKAVRFTLNEGIGALFTSKPVDASRKLYIYETPQVFMRFHVMDDRFEWMQMQCKYVASGGEKYLTIGNFFDAEATMEMTPEQQKIADELNAMREERDNQQVAALAEIDEKYPKVEIDYSDPLKEYSKKEMKAFEKQKQTLQLKIVEQRNAMNRIQTGFDSKIDSMKELYADNALPYFYLRYYFDELSLTPVTPETPCPCQEEIVLEPGEKFKLKNILFETAKWDLLPQSNPALRSLVKILQQNRHLIIQINGHTDTQGDEADNLVLSENRAKAVMDYLISAGIDPARLSYKGFGQTEPVEDNGTAAGRALNRRVEVEILEE